ncbi:MAG: hypothetical protein EOP52_13840 [Sphingobacteriales bacterium]|nr:MAG: hypothetical protein EOP52_13840 [Sphingobacteriales bacterium]
MPRTKALHRYEQRVKDYDTDIEMTELLVKVFLSMRNDNRSLSEAMGGGTSYKILSKRTNTLNSRRIVGYHLRNTVYTSFIKDLFEDFSEYLATTLAKASLTNIDAARFTGESKIDLKASEILSAGSWENVTQLVSDKIFRSIENEKSTQKLIEKVDGKLGLDLDTNILENAMPYLDTRHILVHRDGKADAEFIQKYPQISLDTHGYIKINKTLITEAKKYVSQLAVHIDSKIIAAGFARAQDIAGAINQ